MAVQSAEGEWSDVPPGSDDFAKNLPSLIVGYTSGDNETLSLPFFVSRSGYATDVAQAATFKGGRSKTPGVVADTLYRAFHKIALLNDLAIPRAARRRLEKEIDSRRFASRLPEPQDEDKVFRFEQVGFRRRVDGKAASLDYVSLSDGEHQFAQILGIFSMIEAPDALFILDEPESHFNPLWRVQFTKQLLGLPNAERGRQEVLLTTHAPFVPCDLPREQVLIFSREDGRLTVGPPTIETFGASFDRILDACFGVNPPISQVAQDIVGDLMADGTAAEIEVALTQLGPSVARSFLADRLRQLKQTS